MIFFHQVINPLQQIFRQGGIEANSFPQIRGYIEIDYRPHTAGIVGIPHMCVYFLRTREWITISHQAFKVKGQGFLCIFQSLRDSGACRETARYIGHSHPIVRISVFVQYDWKFHFINL